MTIRVVEHEGGWLQVDIRVRLPDGTRYRERSRAPVQSKSGARRWAEERERYLALSGPKQPKKEVPTLEDFESRFISEHVEANQLKPSTAASYKSRLKNHIRPNLGRLRLDEIDKQSEQRLKAAMKQFDPGTINDTLAVLSRLLNCAAEWGVIGSAPRFANLKTRQTTCGASRWPSRYRPHPPAAAHLLLASRDAGSPGEGDSRAGRYADLSTTMRYMHLSPASLNQAIRLLEQRGPVGGNSGATKADEKQN